LSRFWSLELSLDVLVVAPPEDDDEDKDGVVVMDDLVEGDVEEEAGAECLLLEKYETGELKFDFLHELLLSTDLLSLSRNDLNEEDLDEEDPEVVGMLRLEVLSLDLNKLDRFLLN